MRDQIVLDALKNELKKAKRKESRIKLKVKQYMSAGSDIIEARKSASKLVSKSMNDSDIKELGRLAEIEKNAFKAIQVDAVKLFDDEFNAKRKVREIEEEIHMIEWRNQISKGN